MKFYAENIDIAYGKDTIVEDLSLDRKSVV